MNRPYRPKLGIWRASVPALAAAAVLSVSLTIWVEAILRPPSRLVTAGNSIRVDQELAAKADRAEELVAKAEKLLREAKSQASIPLPDGLSPQDSSFLGEELTPLVTTLGNLEAKRMAANPRWAYTLTYKLHQEGVRAGDIVAASFSGSFPALNTSVMAACSVLQARVIAISSVTASNWGANQAGFTWPEIEARLVQAGLFTPASVAITLGGAEDRAEDLEADAQALASEIQRASALALRAEILMPRDLRQSIDQRLRIYRLHSSRHAPALYINVGGSTASLGTSLAILRQRSGFLRAMPFDLSSNRGVIARFAEMGVPVLNLLNIRDLAFRWNIS
jgi:poly-gamma-glutamate system protein